MVDRLMRFLDRAFFNAQYFHGLPEAAESRVRALALLWNFFCLLPRDREASMAGKRFCPTTQRHMLRSQLARKLARFGLYERCGARSTESVISRIFIIRLVYSCESTLICINIM